MTMREAELLIAGLRRMQGDVDVWHISHLDDNRQRELIEIANAIERFFYEDQNTISADISLVSLDAAGTTGNLTLVTRDLLDMEAMLHSPVPEIPDEIPTEEFRAFVTSFHEFCFRDIYGPLNANLPKAATPARLNRRARRNGRRNS